MKKKELEIIPDHATSLKLLNKDLGAVDGGDAGGIAEDLGHKVYHSTKAKFNKFDKEYIGCGKGESFASGFYFADEPIKEYGDTLTCNISYSNPIIIDLEDMNSVYDYVELLNLNKETVDSYIKYRSGDVKAGLNKAIRDKYGDDLVNVTKLLQSKGYDCVIVENTTVGVKDKVKLDKEYIIFEPEQIEIIDDINEDWQYNDNLTEEYFTPVPKNATIVETSEFLRDAKHLKINDKDIDDLKISLTERPPESSLGSGVYKFRWSPSRWKSGNRGATRVIYVYINKSNYVYLMKIYKKNEQANLTDKEEKLIKELAKQLRGA